MRWSKEELQEISGADEFHIGPANEDESKGSIVHIWSIVIEGVVYVRGNQGRRSHWYQTALVRGSGRISIAGITRDVIFEPVDKKSMIEQIDEEYKKKYQNHEQLKWLLSESARSATLKVVPTKIVKIQEN